MALQPTEQTVPFEGNGAAILVACLECAGISTIFGVPGDTGVALYDALYRRQGGIRHVLARDERHAAIMADAYARTTNSVGVVEASSGGGVTYMVSGLGEPFASSVPLLVISSDIHRRSRGSGAITEIDQRLLFAAVTKWSATAESAAELPRLVAEALTAATSGRPAPVSLVIPEDVFDEQAMVQIPAMSASVPHERPHADPATVAAFAAALQGARQPAIIAGAGVHFSAAWLELAQFAEAAGVPVATSIHGKGAFAENSPWALGVAGANGARDYTNDYLAGADVVLFVGTRANATDTNSYQCPPRGQVIAAQIDIEAVRAGRNYPGSNALVGDVRTVLEQLGDSLPPAEVGRRERLLEWIASRRAGWARENAAPVNLEAGLLNPREVVRAVQHLAGSDVLLLGEPGTPTPNIASYWETQQAGRSILIPRGHGPMGWVIPAAIGAAFAQPGRSIVGLTADGSFAMACGELESAARFKLPIVYIQFTNGSLGWIKMLQHLYAGQRYFGVEPGPIDVVAVARGMGLEAYRVTSQAEFEQIFAQSLARKAPVYIDVPVPDQISLTPPVAPWQATLAGKAGRTAY